MSQKLLKNSFLNQWEIEQNLNAIKKTIKDSEISDAAKAAADYQQKADQLSMLLNDFSTANKITFKNLIDCDFVQYNQLKKILASALTNPLNEAQFNEQLVEWEKTLVDAVPGRGILVDIHGAHPTSFASGLASGSMAFNQWGTDIDIVDCLKNDITDPNKIARSGTYILSPAVITEPESPIALHPAGATIVKLVNIQQKIAAALEEIQLSKVHGPISLNIPVNSLTDSHWRLVKIDIDAGKIIAAGLWDSFSGEESLDFKQAFANLQQAIRYCTDGSVPVIPYFANTQTNSHSCMDLVIQEATKLKADAIQVAGKDLHALRIAVLQKIARNHPKLGDVVAANMTVDNNKVQVVQPKPTEEDDLPEIKKSAFLSSLLDNKNKKSQIEFDEIFAKKLSNLYKSQNGANTLESDALLEVEAFRAAYKEFNFFASAKVIKPEVVSENIHVHTAAPSA